jgi:hypothetical protein
MPLVAVRFIRNFIVAGGPLYVAGDLASLPDWMAEQAIRQRAALREQEATYESKAVEQPTQHKMVTTAANKKG